MSLEGTGEPSTLTALNQKRFQLMTTEPGMLLPVAWAAELNPVERGLYLIHLLHYSAHHSALQNFRIANVALDQVAHIAASDGDAMQRVATYFAHSISDRIFRALPGIYKSFYFGNVSSGLEDVAAKRMFCELLPFMKVAYVVSNRTLMESMVGEKMIHVIDLNASEPVQWVALIRDMNARPEGPPHLKITGIHTQKDVLDYMLRVLSNEAEKLNFPFQFIPVVSTLEDLDVDKLGVKTGEALAIASAVKLHTLLGPQVGTRASHSSSGVDLGASSSSPPPVEDEVRMNEITLVDYFENTFTRHNPSNDLVSLSPQSPYHSPNLYRLLSVMWGLSPKIMVMIEQDADHNGEQFQERVYASLHFYSSLFDCMEMNLPRNSGERLRIERLMLGKEIKNIIACEGPERRERHEGLEKWRKRLELAGFENVPVSYYGFLNGNRMLQQGNNYGGCRIKGEKGSAVICWQDKNLYAVSAWKVKRG